MPIKTRVSMCLSRCLPDMVSSLERSHQLVCPAVDVRRTPSPSSTVESLDEIAHDDYDGNRSEAIRALLEKGLDYDTLEAKNERLERQLAAVNARQGCNGDSRIRRRRTIMARNRARNPTEMVAIRPGLTREEAQALFHGFQGVRGLLGDIHAMFSGGRSDTRHHRFMTLVLMGGCWRGLRKALRSCSLA